MSLTAKAALPDLQQHVLAFDVGLPGIPAPATGVEHVFWVFSLRRDVAELTEVIEQTALHAQARPCERRQSLLEVLPFDLHFANAGWDLGHKGGGGRS
jgi:hypothetical protein